MCRDDKKLSIENEMNETERKFIQKKLNKVSYKHR